MDKKKETEHDRNRRQAREILAVLTRIPSSFAEAGKKKVRFNEEVSDGTGRITELDDSSSSSDTDDEGEALQVSRELKIGPLTSSKPANLPNDPTACTVCYRPNAQACSRCLSILYCDRICQVADYDYHKWLCPKYLEFKNQPRPTPDCKLGVRFMAVECGEELIWLEADKEDEIFEVRKDDNGQIKRTHPLLNSCPRIHKFSVPGEDIKRTGMEMDHSVTFILDATKAEEDVGPINLCIRYLMEEATRADWAGNVVVFAQNGIMSPEGLRDFTMADMREVTNFFKKNGQKTHGRLSDYEIQKRMKRKFGAVKDQVRLWIERPAVGEDAQALVRRAYPDYGSV